MITRSNMPSLLRARGGRTKEKSMVKDVELNSGSLTHKTLKKEPSLRALKAAPKDIEYGLPRSVRGKNAPVPQKESEGSVARNARLVKSRKPAGPFIAPREFGPNVAALEVTVNSKNYDKEPKANRPRKCGLKDGGLAKGGKWIKGVIKHPGALRKTLHVKAGEKIPAAKLEKAEHSKNPTTRTRARLAETLRGFKH